MPAGRPMMYDTAEEMQRLIDLYFLACKAHQSDNADYLVGLSVDELLIINDIDDVFPTVSGLGYVLGLSRQGLLNYEGREEFVDTIKRAKQRIEASLEQRLAGQSPAGTIFNLKNNFGWKDQQQQEISGPNGGPQEHKWTVEVIDATNADT